MQADMRVRTELHAEAKLTADGVSAFVDINVQQPWTPAGLRKLAAALEGMALLLEA